MAIRHTPYAIRHTLIITRQVHLCHQPFYVFLLNSQYETKFIELLFSVSYPLFFVQVFCVIENLKLINYADVKLN